MALELPDLLRRARGDEPADVLLADARVVNVLSGEVHEADVAIAGDTVVGVGRGWTASRVVDLRGRYVAPGLIDAHVHVESAMVPPREVLSGHLDALRWHHASISGGGGGQGGALPAA